MFTSSYNPLQLTQQDDDQNPAMDFPYLYTISLCLCTFSSPPFPAYHIISPPSSLAKLKQCLLWIKYTNAKDIPYPLGPKQVLNTLLQRKSTRSAFAEKECLCDVSPMIIQGAWTRPMPGQPEENLLKSFSQTIYLQLCISIIH